MVGLAGNCIWDNSNANVAKRFLDRFYMVLKTHFTSIFKIALESINFATLLRKFVCIFLRCLSYNYCHYVNSKTFFKFLFTTTDHLPNVQKRTGKLNSSIFLWNFLIRDETELCVKIQKLFEKFLSIISSICSFILQ